MLVIIVQREKEKGNQASQELTGHSWKKKSLNNRYRKIVIFSSLIYTDVTRKCMKVDPKHVNIWVKLIRKVNPYKSSLIDRCTKCFIGLCMCVVWVFASTDVVYQKVTEHLSVCSPAYWRLEVSRRVLVYQCVFFSVCVCVCERVCVPLHVGPGIAFM